MAEPHSSGAASDGDPLDAAGSKAPTQQRRTFLFTDVQGSTPLWETRADAMREALWRHDVLVKTSLETHGGHVFNTRGDGFCAAFARPEAAAVAALALQRALTGEVARDPDGLTLSVRVALYTGKAEVRGGDYFGVALSRVDRLLEIGHGGQTLLCQATRDALSANGLLPPGAFLRDLGRHRLRDLQTPERVYQLCHAELPAGPNGAPDFPPLRSPAAEPFVNLPRPLTDLIGRERERTEVAGLLQGDARLLSLLGTGGTGKTRLALQAAQDYVDRGAGGACLVELAALSDPALVARAVLNALRLPEQVGRPLADTLIEHLNSGDAPKSDGPLLLVLDNCEHVIVACAHLAETLLGAGPHLRILATSREPLGVASEIQWRVPSLAVPAQNPQTAAEAEAFAAVRLFVERARAALPAFRLTDANAPALTRICRHLDGIPLAIELAAAWAPVLSPAQIETRLSDRFNFLTRGAPRSALPRQKTLQALIDWSHDLLDPAERALLARLSVFAGGCTLDAVEAVCSDTDLLARPRVLDVLSRLVAKSLVVSSTNDEAGHEAGDDTLVVRYRLLETIRQYAAVRLREAAGDEETAARARHQAHFLAFSEQAEPHLQGPEAARWFDRLETEHDNLRAALAGKIGSDQARLRLVGALFWFWYVRGYLSEGRRWLCDVLAQSHDLDPDAAAHAKALKGTAWLFLSSGDAAQADALFHESLQRYRALGDRRNTASVLNNLGVVKSRKGEYAVAHQFYAEALALYRSLGDTARVASTLNNIATVAIRQQDYAAARLSLEETLPLQRNLGDRLCLADTLENLGNVFCDLGDNEQAIGFLQECLTIRRDLGNKSGVAVALNNIATVWQKQGSLLEAAWAFGASEAAREAIGVPLAPEDFATYKQECAALRERLGAQTFQGARDKGRAMTIEQSIEFALTTLTTMSQHQPGPGTAQ